MPFGVKKKTAPAPAPFAWGAAEDVEGFTTCIADPLGTEELAKAVACAKKSEVQTFEHRKLALCGLLVLTRFFEQERKKIWSEALASIPEPDARKTIWKQQVGESDCDQVRPVI